jgi:hypothetical protein
MDHFSAKTTTQQQPPLILTKKWLYHHFCMCSNRGAYNKKALYSKVLTPQVLSQAGLTVQEVRCTTFRVFTRQQTVIILKELGL